MGKLTNILNGVILMSLIVTGMIAFYSSGVDTYSPEGYNSTQLEQFSNALGNVSDNVNNTRTALEDVGAGSTGVIDILGGMFQSGYTAAKTVLTSMTTMFDIATFGVASVTPLGTFATPLLTALTALIIIAVVIGVFLHIITKSDRI